MYLRQLIWLNLVVLILQIGRSQSLIESPTGFQIPHFYVFEVIWDAFLFLHLLWCCYSNLLCHVEHQEDGLHLCLSLQYYRISDIIVQNTSIQLAIILSNSVPCFLLFACVATSVFSPLFFLVVLFISSELLSVLPELKGSPVVKGFSIRQG